MILTIDEIKNKGQQVFADNDFVERAYLFGSYARGEADENSDVDIMIGLNRIVGLPFFGLYEYLSDIYNKNVDVITEDEAYTIMPKSIERDKILIYERKN